MTTLIDIPSAGSAPEPEAGDVPRPVRRSLSRADNVFRWSTTLIGAVVLLITASIGGFLGFQLIPTLRDYGLRFFTENQWNPNSRFIGISAALIGTAEVAIIALAISFPLALLTALYITEYAPSWLRGIMVSMVDQPVLRLDPGLSCIGRKSDCAGVQSAGLQPVAVHRRDDRLDDGDPAWLCGNDRRLQPCAA
jgi:hypothetical protein